jgi:hypothetical protein
MAVAPAPFAAGTFPSGPSHGQSHTHDNGLDYVWNANLFGPGEGGWELAPSSHAGIPEPPNDDQMYARQRPSVGAAEWSRLDDGVY